MSSNGPAPLAQLPVTNCHGPLQHEAPHLDLAPDPQLVAAGWQRRFMADPVRAREAFDIYRSLGFEVRAETMQPSELSTACGDCRLVTCRAYVVIYTRRLDSNG
jgi:hypothetical protein